MTLGRPDYLCFQVRIIVCVARPPYRHTDKYLQLETQIPSVMAESLVKHCRLNLPVQVLGFMQNTNKTKRNKLKDTPDHNIGILSGYWALVGCCAGCLGQHVLIQPHVGFSGAPERQEKKKTTPFGVNLSRNPVLYWAAQKVPQNVDDTQSSMQRIWGVEP